MDPHVELNYLSVACNCSPHTLDWNSNDTLCYASCCSVIVKGHLKGSNTFNILNGHSKRVNSVRWVKHLNGKAERELISTSSDKTAKLWTVDICSKTKPCLTDTLHGHTDTVTIADGHYVPVENGMSLLVITASADSTIRIWQRGCGKTDVLMCKQIEKLGNGFALDLRITLLPKISVPIFAASTDDLKITLFAQQNDAFIRLHTLSGHEDWVRCLDFISTKNGDLLLASGGQDCSIRLWKIHQHHPDTKYINCPIAELPQDHEITLDENLFKVIHKGMTHHFAVVLEAVMIGHENWIYGVHWQPKENDSGDEQLCLLSSSMDKTLILWTPTSPSGLWLEKLRLGEVAGNTMGFYGGKFNSSGTSIITHGYQGSFHLWCFNMDDKLWIPRPVIGGHFDEVNDLDWEPSGRYLLTTSADQTSRLHAPWKKNAFSEIWHEFARPQIHGYDMTCIASISFHKFISGADEKILRVFDAPRTFLKNMTSLCGINVLQSLDESALPERAAVPALSLSNKAIFNENGSENADRDVDSMYIPLELKEPPTEEELVRGTLWPETKKLYGHGFEIFCVAVSHRATVVASASKASKLEHAKILLWEIGTWKIIGELESHSLTVTQLEFSPNDTFLLSVSRDRTWSLFMESFENEGERFKKIAFTDKATSVHTRIIWSCSWTHDSKYFATGSRDKKVIVWGQNKNVNDSLNNLQNYCPVCSPLILKDSVTAVAFSTTDCPDNRYLLAVGLESGEIYLYFWTSLANETQSWTQCYSFSENFRHHLSISRLRFRPVQESSNSPSGNSDWKLIQLASCSKDHAVKIFNITFNK